MHKIHIWSCTKCTYKLLTTIQVHDDHLNYTTDIYG